MQLYVKDLHLREQWAMRDTGFSSEEVERFKTLYLASTSEAKSSIWVVCPLPLMTLPELQQAWSNDRSSSVVMSALQTVKSEVSDFATPRDGTDQANILVNFPQFLRISKILM